MDNTIYEHDNVTLADTGIPGGAVADSLASSAKNLFKGIRDRAKAKAAKKTADSGGYWTLRPYLKSLIAIPQYIVDQVAGQGITEEAVLQLPAQSVGTSNTQIISELKKLSGTVSVGATNINPTGNTILQTEQPEGTFKKLLPYIGGALILGLIGYVILKK